MKQYRHRVAFNCDLFMDVVTSSPDSPIGFLEKQAQETLRRMAGVDSGQVLSDRGLDVDGGGMLGMRVYPRIDEELASEAGFEIDDRLENFTLEHMEETTESLNGLIALALRHGEEHGRTGGEPEPKGGQS